MNPSSKAGREIPFDLAAAARLQDWRDGFAWPLPHARIRVLGDALGADFAAFLGTLARPDERDVCLLAAGRMLTTGLALSETALWLQAADGRGISFAGGPPELFALRGELAPDGGAYTAAAEIPRPALRWGSVRRVVRTASWTPARRLPATLLAPSATAVSHNSLLRAWARDSRERVAYRHAEFLLAAARRRRPAADFRPDIAGLAGRMAGLFAAAEGLASPFRERVAELSRAAARALLETAAANLAALRAAPRLPLRLWAGTGGYDPVRALRIEVRHRGGQVTGFDHGGSIGLVDEPIAFTLAELGVSDRYVMPTAAIAGRLAAKLGRHALGATEIIAGCGDPAFATTEPGRPSGRPRRPRLLYVCGPFIGARQRMPPRIPDLVKLDWQMRVAEMLKLLPVELLCQPHPGGAMRGRPHPLSAVAPVSGKTYEEVIDWADIVVIDMIQSTTFWKALCGPKAVILLDLGMCDFNDWVKPVIARRCRIIEARYDDRNLPLIDRAELEEAIRAAPQAVDPTEFRELLAGPAA